MEKHESELDTAKKMRDIYSLTIDDVTYFEPLTANEVFQATGTIIEPLDTIMDDLKQFLHKEIVERRDYSASKSFEVVLEKIKQLENNSCEL